MYSTEQVRDILLGESLQDRFSRMLCTLNNELRESGPTLFYALLEYSIEEFYCKLKNELLKTYLTSVFAQDHSDVYFIVSL